MQESKFNFNIPLEIIEKGNDTWQIGGVASTENKDFQGETVKIDGLDISTLSKNGFFNQDHKSGFENILGKVQFAEKRENENDGKHLYVEGKLFKTQPASKAAWNIMQELGSSDKQMQLSVEGKILKREGKDKKTITKAKVENIALTLNPINDNTFASFLKSFRPEDNLEISGRKEPQDIDESIDSNFVNVSLQKSTYEKLMDIIDSKKSFKEHVFDLVKGMDKEEREKIFKVLRKSKEEFEKANYTKRTGTPGNYKYEYGDKKELGSKKKREVAYIDSEGQKVHKDELEGKKEEYLKRENKEKDTKTISIKDQPKEIQDAVETINGLGPSLSDASQSQQEDYDSAMKKIKAAGFFMEMGDLKQLNKALTATHSYATELPAQRTGGDVMTQESLDRDTKKEHSIIIGEDEEIRRQKKKKNKDSLKMVIGKIKKSFPNKNIREIVKMTIKKYLEKGEKNGI